MKKTLTILQQVPLTTLILLLVMTHTVGNIYAAPPHPDLLEQVAAGKKVLPYYLTHLDEMHAKGICVGKNAYEKAYAAAKGMVQQTPMATGNFNVLAVLVQFSDNNNTSPATFFDSLMFDSVGNTVHDYYQDISYGQLDLVTLNLPSSLGWINAPQTYAYYVNNQNGLGSYPNNSQRLVEDLVNMIDPSVDFSKYDNDSNGYVDVMVIIHAGAGAEKTGDSTDFWSHKWSISPKMTGEGVYVSSFTVQPEFLINAGDMTIGVYAHELGHAFGLPDLYDTDYGSRGIGKWGIMAYGSWLGPSSNGGLPSHPCAWSRIQMGFASATVISSNIDSQAIPDVKTSGNIYRLWTSGNISNEYFLVENRQKTGYDTYIPASGLHIWHIDDGKANNDSEWWPGMDSTNHYLVAMEQADGLFELEHNNDYGDGGDVFPGTYNATTFNALSSTNSNSYTSGVSFVAVENISSPASTMFADLKVSFASDVNNNNGDNLPTTIQLSQNYPNPFNPTTTIDFNTSVNGLAKIEVLNILGRKVKTLLNEYVTAGTTFVIWDGTNDNGNEIASGIYLYKLVINDQEQVKKMVLIR